MKVLVMFLGERADNFDGINQLFVDKKGEKHLFRGLKYVWFGNVYEMTDGKMKVRPEAVESDWTPTEEQRLEYEAQKLAVCAIRERRKKKNLSRKPHKDILRAVELLRPFYKPLSKWDRERLTDWLTHQLSKAKK